MSNLKSMKGFPIQPIVKAKDGCIRFKENRIVSAFWEAAGEGRKLTLNDIAIKVHMKEFTRAELMQFNMLIGYSVSGFGDLSTSSKEVVDYADRTAAFIAKRQP